MKKLTSIFVISFLLIGCTPRLVITPDKLMDALLGQPYHDEIIISVGSGPVSPASFDYSIKPNNSGLELYSYSVDDQFNHFVVKGIPNTLDDIVIHMTGETELRSPFYSPKEFNKTYVIKVKEKE
ncbi:hypothetical protein [Entomomonas asaccharolytica]|uniref:Lipoprotein n=1 Tax=Entomomonas asaccharolytica TaxID=2785331 RepID=A0A974NDH6_9GAMM|nr:hypothetical protein [Entomomonas asaccharolytica]QQP84643.1 hypothetical protein JHT90_09500 [Entomomonas asaccharolytica]